MKIDKKQLEISLSRLSLIDFCEYTKHDWQTNWHHEFIADQLDKVIEDVLKGKKRQLIITCPPQVGKSEVVTRRFPAYAFGRNPNFRIASCSYSQGLSSSMNRDVQRIIDSPEYRDVFPDVRLNSKHTSDHTKLQYRRNTEVFDIVGGGGFYKSTSIMGPLTGTPIDIGIIDDPIRDAVQANSLKIRNNIFDWYKTVFSTRLQSASAQIVILTRWNEDDLAGRLISGKGNWEVLKLEALKETPQQFDPRAMGEALWPGKYDKKWYEDVKRESGSRVFESLYQQNPRPQEGTIIRQSHIKTMKGTPRVMKELIQSWDLSFKGNANSDYVVGSVWCRIDANYYLVDMVRGRWDFNETLRQFEMLTDKWPSATRKVVEDAANGAALYSSLRNKIPGIVLWKPKTGKIERLQAVSPLFESGNVILNEELPHHEDLVSELCSFPYGINDDMVDSCTQALINFKGSSSFFARGKKRSGMISGHFIGK